MIRATIFSLLGTVAEVSSHVRQRRSESSDGSGETLTFDVVTGIVDETPFKPHGHTLRLHVAANLSGSAPRRRSRDASATPRTR
jgi:hypothetical protein